MSFFQNPSFYIQTAEHDVVLFFQKAEAGLAVIEQDFLNVVSWVSANAGEIGGLLAGLLGAAASIPTGNIPVAITSGLTILQQGLALVQQASAAAAAEKAAGGTVSQQTMATLASGYAFIKQAEALGATAAGTTASPSTSAVAPVAAPAQ